MGRYSVVPPYSRASSLCAEIRVLDRVFGGQCRDRVCNGITGCAVALDHGRELIDGGWVRIALIVAALPQCFKTGGGIGQRRPEFLEKPLPLGQLADQGRSEEHTSELQSPC